jgi:hypothetical protein
MYSFLFLVLASFTSSVYAQGPVGDPDEVWVTSSSGDTLFVGELVMLEVHIAMSTVYDAVGITFELSSSDGAGWEWIDLGEHGPFELIENSRMYIGTDVFVPEWAPSSPSGAPADTFCIGGISWDAPDFEPGQLEHSYNISIRPTEVGTICIDSGFIPPGAVPWHFTSNDPPYLIQPTWGGPYCFTVLPSQAKGDVNCDGDGNLGDAVYLINWIFKGGPEPCK